MVWSLLVLGVQAQDFQQTYDLNKNAGSALDAPDLKAFGKLAGDNFGRVVRTGDLNGDGIDDLIVGAPLADAGSPVRADSGAVYVWFGKDNLAGTKDVASAGGGAPDLTIMGAGESDQLCRDGALEATDINGDGVEDLLIGAALADGPNDERPGAGEAYIVFGRTSEESFPAVLDLSVKGSGGADVTFYGASNDDQLTIGGAMAVGDVNGDDRVDVLLGAVLADGPANGRASSGEAYVMFGRSGAAPFPVTLDLAIPGSAGADVTLYGASQGDFLTFGGAIGVGDVNEDGVVDIILGSRDADGPNEGRSSSGEAYLIFGRTVFPQTLDMGTQGSAGADVTMYGASAQDQLTSGGSLAVGDVNGDGFADLLLGSPGGDGPGEGRLAAGEAYIVSGRAIFPVTLDLAVHGGNGASATIYGSSSQDQMTSGGSLTVGDVNGDGFTDLMVGAPLADGPGEARGSAGEAYIVLGGASFPETMDLNPSTEGDHADVTIYGASPDDNLAIEGALTVGDVNGDGASDLILGSRLADGPLEGRSNAGEAYVVFGRDDFSATIDLSLKGLGGADVTIYGGTSPDQLTSGAALATGDINGDGFADLIVSTTTGDGPEEGRMNAGETAVIFGTGSLSVAPDIAIEQPAGTNIPDGGSRFGAILIGGNATRTFTIRNTGVQTLSGLVVVKDGANASDYVVGNLPSTSVEPGMNLTYTVTFTPSALGTRSAALHVESNDPNENPFDIVLTGTGTAPEIEIEQPAGTAFDEGTTQSFGTMHTGGQALLTFTVRNSGSADLAGVAVTKSGPQADEYLVGPIGSATVPAGGSTTFAVAFAPTGLGTRNATLSIASNDGDENPFVIEVTGIGKLPAPEITIQQPAGTERLDQATLTFGVVPVGNQSGLTITVKNTGSAALTGLAASLEGTHAGDYALGALGSVSLIPGASTTFNVTFDPGAAGVRTATLSLASNDEDENPFHLLLSGIGVDPEIVVEQPAGTDVVDGGSHDFGQVLVGESSTKTFTIRNTGTTELVDLTLTKEGSHAGSFVVGALGSTTVAPGESTTFSIQFAPSARGTVNAVVRLANNDANENPFDLQVTGLGLAPEIAVEDFQSAGLADNAGVVSLGGTVIEEAGVVRTFTVRNVGNSELSGLQLSKTGAGQDDFVIVGPVVTSLAGGASTTFTVTFNPLVVGVKSVVIQVASNDADEAVFEIAVSAEAYAKEPVFPPQVLSRWVTVGQPLTLAPIVTGSNPKVYQWYKGTAKIAGAAGSGAAFNVALAKAGDVGIYSLRVTNGFVTAPVISPSGYVGVVTRGPTGLQVNAGAILNLTCAATVPAGSQLTYQWKRGNVALTEGGRVSGAKGKALKITGLLPEEAGIYTCEVTMKFPGNEIVGTNGETMVVAVQTPTVGAFTLDDAYVGEDIYFVIPTTNDPTSFTVANLPAGVVVSKTGVLSGKPKAAKLVKNAVVPYVLKVSCKNSAGTSAVREVSWKILPLDTRGIGTFNGLVERHTSLNGGLGGSIKVTSTSAAGFSGTLKLGALSYLLTGSLTTPTGGGDLTGALAIPRKAPLTNLTLSWTIDLETGELTGEVDDPVSSPAPMSAWRTPWSTANKATLYAYNYTAALTPGAAVPEDAALYPQGEGYALLTVTTAGVATWGGKLADGTAITGATTLGPNGEVPLQVMLYTNTGSVQGWGVIDATGNFDNDGVIDWNKAVQPVKSAVRSYKGGIGLHELVLRGGRYVKPVSGPVLGLPVAVGNAQVDFMSGGLVADFSQVFTITDKNAVVVATAAADNPKGVKITLATATGLIGGSFTLSDPDPFDAKEPIAVLKRPAPFNGVLVTRLNRAAGHFNLPLLPVVTGETIAKTAILSGWMSLGARPATP